MNRNENGVPEELAAATRARAEMEDDYESWRYYWKDPADHAIRQAFLASGMVVPSRAATLGAKMPCTYHYAMKIAAVAAQAAKLTPYQEGSPDQNRLRNDLYRRDMVMLGTLAQEAALIFVDNGTYMPYRWAMLGFLQMLRNALVPAVLDASDRQTADK
jgi:hypothetical protein